MSTNITSFNSATIVGKKTDEPDKKGKTVMVFGKQTSLIKFRYDGKCDTLAILPNRYEISSTHTNEEQTDYLTTADLIKVDGKTIAQKNMRVFLSTIENNKESLMKDLGLNEPEYYRLMNIALGIAEQETHFGDYTFIDPCNNENWQKRLHVKNFISALPISCSKGLTQIKYSANFRDGSKNKAIAIPPNEINPKGIPPNANNPIAIPPIANKPCAIFPIAIIPFALLIPKPRLI